MIFDIEKLVKGKRVIGFGAGEYLDRAIQQCSHIFEYFVDDKCAGQEKYGRPVYPVNQLAKERKDVVIFIFERYVPAAIEQLTQFGYSWLKNIFDARYFGIKTSFYDSATTIRNTGELARSELINIYVGFDSKLKVENLILPQKGETSRKINIYLGTNAELNLSDVIIEEGSEIYVGQGGTLNIGSGTTIESNSVISSSNNSQVDIGKNVLVSHDSVISAATGTSIKIGEETTMGWDLLLYAYAPISIGRACMISSKVFIGSGDGHDIVINNEKRYPQPIDIGPQVWLGMGANIISGGGLEEGSMAGAFSLVNQKFGRGLLVVGNPARMIKDNVKWYRDYTAYKELFHQPQTTTKQGVN